MKVLIFGFGLHGGGFASARYFIDRGHEVRITDLRTEPALGERIDYFKKRGAVVITGEHRVEDFEWADVVVKNPAIPVDNSYLVHAKKIINDFYCLFSSEIINCVKLICITGTKGKTTTASAVAHALNELGHPTQLCGNMGISAFTVLEEWEKGNVPEYLVCEMSSWQVRDTFNALNGQMPNLEVAALTSIYEDHQNSYHSVNNYIQDKMELFECTCHHIVCPYELKKMISASTGVKTSRMKATDGSVLKMARSLPPSMVTAYTILSCLDFRSSQINVALRSFKGVPHRTELVGHKGNLLFINDSAATIPEAVNFSVQNFSNVPVHLICGGTDKDLHAEGMRLACKSSASIHLLDGSFTKQKLIPMLNKFQLSYDGPFKTMEEAVNSAISKTDQKSNIMQVILLSPGAASFELFDHEFDRGDKFRNYVVQIINTEPNEDEPTESEPSPQD